MPRDVLSIDRHRTRRDLDRRGLRNPRHRRFIIERDAGVKRFPGDGAIHGAAVDVAVTERGRDRARNGPLPCARGSINRDDQPLRQFHASLTCQNLWQP